MPRAPPHKSRDDGNYQISVLKGFDYTKRFPRPLDITEQDAVLMSVYDELRQNGHAWQSREDFIRKKSESIDKLSTNLTAIDERLFYENTRILYTYNRDPGLVSADYAARDAVESMFRPRRTPEQDLDNGPVMPFL